MSQLTAAFQELDQWLSQHRIWWDVRTFEDIDWPWRATHPEFADYLDALVSQQNADRKNASDQNAASDPSVNSCPITWLIENGLLALPPESNGLSDLSKGLELFDYPAGLQSGIKGRKWQQISDFLQIVHPKGKTVEWCAGKGHLGKAISHRFDVPVVSVEWQQGLCDAGQQSAEQLNLNQRFVQADVLKRQGDEVLKEANTAVALHACGDLHRVLIQEGVGAGIQQFGISPCCYHLTFDEIYRPLSQQARRSNLSLTKENLKLAVKEVVTAGEREKRLRELELTYRLGFDSWQREALNSDHYLNVPSLPKAILIDGFNTFCQWVISQKRLPLSISGTDLETYLALGEMRRRRVEIVEAVTQHFRRALELWLVLDRALYLEEQGYQVVVGEFCKKALTPRNLMILANQNQRI